MPANRNEIIRNEILDQCYINRPLDRDAERMVKVFYRDCELEMKDATAAEFEREAAYLLGRGLIEGVPADVAKNHMRWKITAAGIDHMESQGHKV
jgi:hypothetical protein